MQAHLLITGIFYPGGGLGGVLTHLLRHLTDNLKVSCLAFVPSSILPETPVSFDAHETFIIPFHRNLFEISDTPVAENIRSHTYTHVLTLGPLGMNEILVHQIMELDPQVQLLGFIPHEGSVVNTYDFEKLNRYRYGVFYSRHVFEQYKALNQGTGILDNFENRFGYAYHGIEFNRFYPLAEQPEERIRKGREAIAEHAHLPENAIVILNSNQAFYRKGLHTTLEAFQQVRAQVSHAYLHLHFGQISPGTLARLQKEIGACGMERILLTYSLLHEPVRPVEWMNHLYNACNIALTTSYGEGWGLGIYEHAATGAAVVAPNHTVFTENWKDSALLADIQDTQFLFYENSEIYIPSGTSVARQVLRLIRDPEVYHQQAARCYRNVHSGKYDWAATGQYFTNLIQQSIH